MKNRPVEIKANKCTQGNATKYDNVKTHIWKGKKIEMQNENKGFAMCILVKKYDKQLSQ